jgi:hypothetical protein
MKTRIISLILIIFFNSNVVLYSYTENYLERKDKHFLGGGRMVVWAPQFPQFLDKPGFWDYAFFLHYRVEPLFTVTFLDAQLKPVELTLKNRSWVPSHLTQNYSTEIGLEITEQKALLADDICVSHFTIQNKTDEKITLQAVLWTCQPINQSFPDSQTTKIKTVNVFRNRISWERQISGSTFSLGLAMGAQKLARSSSANQSEGRWNLPLWELTPFYEKITNEGFPEHFQFNLERANPGYLYLALEYKISIPPQDNFELSTYCAIAGSEQDAIEAFDQNYKLANPIEASQDNWENFFSSVPSFRCSDSLIERYFYYRWYTIRMNMIDTRGKFQSANPCLFEGIHSPEVRHQRSYSAPAQMIEARWLHYPEPAQGCLLNFLNQQLKNGSIPGVLNPEKNKKPGTFCHANWGYAIREFYRVQPNFDLLQQIYHPLSEYAGFIKKYCDPENLHLASVYKLSEIGRDFEYRFPNMQMKNEFTSFKAIDISVYYYELQRTLAWIADLMSYEDDATQWKQQSQLTKQAILTTMWDEPVKLFKDYDHHLKKKSVIKNAVDFFPFLTDIALKNHLPSITEHLLDPNEFLTDYPIPSISIDESEFNSTGEWQDQRMMRPTNGRSWPIITSPVVEALAQAATRFDQKLKVDAAGLLKSYLQTFYTDGDLKRPNSYEYYNPLTGKPPVFEGSDDSITSWIVDLIIQYIAGLQPSDNNLIIIDPLPMGLTHFTLDNAIVKGRVIKIIWRGNEIDPLKNGFFVFVDGHLVAKKTKLTRIEIRL